jgi:hypothetical protein
MLTQTIPMGPIQMTAIVTDCHSTIETRIVCQATGDTIRTNYHDNLDSAVEYLNQFSVDKIEYDHL